ncbi:hypothetical protein [Paraburkholderia youngii]|uniref:hypothetical protein n=1 Tax=Paraburkholderia youngii TaxID=2782701 RepID=UPI003D21D058
MWRTGLKYVFWALLPIAVCSLIPISRHFTDLSIRIAGAGLQGWGLLYIVIGIARTRQQFSLPSVSQFFAERLREFPRYPAPITSIGNITAAAGTSSGRGTVTVGFAEPRDVESRLDALEKNLHEFKTTVANQHGETLAQLRRQDTELERERTERAEQDTRLKSMLHETATGGLDLAVYGVIAVFFATICCTFSQELSQRVGTGDAQSASTQIIANPGQSEIYG